MHRRIAELAGAALLLAGCAAAEVVSSAGETHTLRVEGSRAYNRNHVHDALQLKASALCPDGFDVLDDRTVGPWRAGDGLFQAHPAAYEWRVRCS